MTQETLAQDSGPPLAADKPPSDGHESGLAFIDLAILFVDRWKLLLLGPLVAGLLAVAVTYLIVPTFTARTVFLPPQQQQSLATSALASLGALSSLAGGVAGFRSPIDQYVSLLQSTTIADRVIDKFDIMRVYDKEYRLDARKGLTKNVRIVAGRKDGLITIEVDDEDPKRAADMANYYVDELRRLTSQLALTEAQQRRHFFEGQLAQTRERLTQAQGALQASGFNPGALKAEPRAAAEGYAKLRAELTAAEVRLQTLRQNLANAAPEVQQQGATVAALRSELAKLEVVSDSGGDAGYIGKYRDFKYQETLFELFSRQYEIARLDESREGALIQVVDVAMPAEKKTRPRRALTAITVTAGTLLLLLAYLIIRKISGQSRVNARDAAKWSRLRAAFRWR